MAYEKETVSDAGSKGRAERPRLSGPRYVIERGDPEYPAAFDRIAHPPKQLYLIGNPGALEEGIAIIGARKATPYGRGCARRFAKHAAERGIAVISGGARGCDGEAHCGALEAGGKTVVILGGGCDELYPAQHFKLFQDVVSSGGAVMSEQAWGVPPLPAMFRQRNRLIAGLAKATLIVEAGLPSGTFSTADEALSAGRDVLAVPGAITSLTSAGANKLILQGATPVIDDDSFDDALFSIFGVMKQERFRDLPSVNGAGVASGCSDDAFIAAILAEPLGEDELYALAEALCNGQNAISWMSERLLAAQREGVIRRYPDGRYGAAGEKGGKR